MSLPPRDGRNNFPRQTAPDQKKPRSRAHGTHVTRAARQAPNPSGQNRTSAALQFTALSSLRENDCLISAACRIIGFRHVTCVGRRGVSMVPPRLPHYISTYRSKEPRPIGATPERSFANHTHRSPLPRFFRRTLRRQANLTPRQTKPLPTTPSPLRCVPSIFFRRHRAHRFGLNQTRGANFLRPHNSRGGSD